MASKPLKPSLKFTVGEEVEAYRASSPEKVEWLGTVIKLRNSSILQVELQGFLHLSGCMKDTPVRLDFLQNGDKFMAMSADQLKIRRRSSI